MFANSDALGAERGNTLSLLGDEYKILQDKIDKIGAFRVTIKGWSVTATIAALVAISTSKGFSPFVNALALDVLLAWFFWFEREKVRLEWAFNARARDLEVQFDKARRADGEKVLFSTPNIARALFGRKKRRDFIWFQFRSRKLEKWRIRINSQIRLAINSDLVFYVVLGCAAWLPSEMGTLPQPSAAPVVIQNLIQTPGLNQPSAQKTPAPQHAPSAPHSSTKVHSQPGGPT